MSSLAEHCAGKRSRGGEILGDAGGGYLDINTSTNGSNRDGDKAITRPTTEAEYVKKNLKRQRLVTAQLNELLKQETKQLQKLQSKQTRNNQVPLLEWFSKQSKVELLAMVQIGSILFNLNNSFKRSDVEVINAGHISKRQLAHYVVSRFTRGELAQLKQENQRLVLGEKQRQENAIYQQRRLFDIFKQWLLQAGDGKIFECSYSSVSSLYSFQYWYSEFEVIAENQSSFLPTRFRLRYDPKHNLWFECLASLEDQSQAHQVYINYSQCLYDYLSATVMISSSSLSSCLPVLQAKWIPNEDNLHLDRAVSPNNMKLRAALFAEASIPVKLIRFCNDCSRRMIMEFEIVDSVVGVDAVKNNSMNPLTNPRVNSYQPCQCLNRFIPSNNSSSCGTLLPLAGAVSRRGTVPLGCEYIDLAPTWIPPPGALLAYGPKPWQLNHAPLSRKSPPGEHCAYHLRSKLHLAGCPELASMSLEIDLTPLLQQDRERLIWQQFVQATTVGSRFQHTPVVQLVSEFIGLV